MSFVGGMVRSTEYRDTMLEYAFLRATIPFNQELSSSSPLTQALVTEQYIIGLTYQGELLFETLEDSIL